MKKKLLVLLFLIFHLEIYAQYTQLGSKLVGSGSIGNSSQGVSVSISADGKTALVVGYHDNSNIGGVWVYTFNGTNFVQFGNKLIGSGAIGNAQQGSSVSISADGKVALVGGYSDDSDKGGVWVFTFNGSNFIQLGNKLVGDNINGSSQQGIAVSISADGKTALVGGSGDNIQQGAVWAYTYNGVNFVQLGSKLVGSGFSFPGASQGGSVSLSADGKIAVIGGPTYFSTGAIWIYTFNGTNFVQAQDPLVGTGVEGLSCNQGCSVSISADGKTIVTGGSSDNLGKGATWVYTFNGSNYVQFGNKLVGTNANESAGQGFSVSISGDKNTTVIWGPGNDLGRGTIWIYTFDGSNYIQAGSTFSGSNMIGFSQEGTSLSISENGKTIITGGNSDNNNLGAAWVFYSLPLPQSIVGFTQTGTTFGTYTISGVTATSGLPVIFTSSNPSVATISGNVIYFLSPGVTTITAFQPGDATYAAADPIPKKLTVGFTAPTINFSGFVTTVGNSVNLANLFSSDSPGNVSFSSSESSKAVVTSGSTLVALTPGVVTITGTQATSGVYLGGSKDIVINIVAADALGKFIQYGDKHTGTGAIGPGLQGTTAILSGDGKTALVGGYRDNSDVGAVWVYTNNGNNFVQVGNKLVGSNAIGVSSQGGSIGISADGKTIIVGGSNDNSEEGAAWIFTFNGTDFIQLGNKLIVTGGIGSFVRQGAVCISADGKTALVGGFGDNSNQGAVWVFTYNGNNFIQFGNKLTGTGSITPTYFGSSLSLSADGKTALIGGDGDNSNQGAAWVFTFNGSNYIQVGNKLTGSDAVGNTEFGNAVSLSADGKTALIGGYLDNGNNGATWAFTFNGSNYAQIGNKLVGADMEGAASFGSSVSISADGKTALIGGPFDNVLLGAAWIYTYNGTNFDQSGNKIIGSGYTNSFIYQGYSVGLSADGRSAIIGGNGDDSNIGAAWFFVNTTTSCNSPKINGATASPVGYYSVSVSGVTPFTYKWYRNGTLINTTTTSNNFNLLNIYSDAHYFCIISNACGADTSTNVDISVDCIPINNLPITGPSSVSQCSTNSYEITDVGGRNYVWSTNSGIISDPSNQTISVYWTTSGTQLLRMTASNECSTVSSFVNISVIPNSFVNTTLTKPLIGRNNNNLIVNNPLSGVNYQWIYNATEEQGQITSNHTVALKQGAYQVKALYPDCQLTFSDIKNILTVIQTVTITNIELDCVTQVEKSKETNIEVYPNPGSGLFNLIYENADIGKLEVFNALGKIVYNNIFDKIIDIGEQPSGIYLLRVYSQSGYLLKNFRLIIE